MSAAHIHTQLNQQGAVKLTPHHCLVYVITTACTLLPRQRCEECPQHPEISSKHTPPPPWPTVTLVTLTQEDRGGLWLGLVLLLTGIQRGGLLLYGATTFRNDLRKRNK